MNLFNLYPLVFVACIGAGVVVAMNNGAPPLSGAFYGMLAGIAPVVLLGILYAGMMWWRPDLPPCKCGKTKYGEYEYIRPMEGFTADTWFENRCPKCGRYYKSNRNVVVECDDSGSTFPFMKVSRWGRWVADDPDPSAGADAYDPASAITSRTVATFPPTEVCVAFAIEYCGVEEVLDWAEGYARDHPELDAESPLFEILWLNRDRKDDRDRVGELLDRFIARVTPDFDASSKDSQAFARMIFMSRLAEYLTESCRPWDVCRMVQPIEALYDFPNWLGNTYNACDEIGPDTGSVDCRYLEQSIREHLMRYRTER